MRIFARITTYEARNSAQSLHAMTLHKNRLRSLMGEAGSYCVTAACLLIHI